ncbi:uncharacterized protein LOC131676232 [Topomyia yanbarensis]|uniref:uncharacterized protein LOC131676232 n=1 Tax=Topomyia yanbarensis TaxID=2498891 RepID=UPI00273B0FF2|nr:uncharacterized protein LOC131676232 [Topomyia yanbarensis]
MDIDSNQIDVFQLSSYAQKLPKSNPNVYQRYIDKIKVIGNIDPYCIKFRLCDLPTSVTTGSVVDFLINFRSPYTGNSMKNSRSLEGYKKFESGFVHTVEGMIIEGKYVVVGKVVHSMRMNEKMLQPWIIIDNRGTILSSHCNCVAGVSETCSHVSAILYYLANLHAQSTDRRTTVTGMPAYWRQPPKRIKEDVYKQVQDTDYGKEIKKFHDSTYTKSKEDFVGLLKTIARAGGDAVILNRICDCTNYLPHQMA